MFAIQSTNYRGITEAIYGPFATIEEAKEELKKLSQERLDGLKRFMDYRDFVSTRSATYCYAIRRGEDHNLFHLNIWNLTETS